MSASQDTFSPKSVKTSKRGSATPIRYREILHKRTNDPVAPIKRVYPRESVPARTDDTVPASPPQSTGAAISFNREYSLLVRLYLFCRRVRQYLWERFA